MRGTAAGMLELPGLMRSISRTTFFFLSVGCLGWAVWPDLKSIFGGFLIGSVGGWLIAWHLAWKTARIAAVAATGRRSRSGFGFLSRAALALLAVVISVRTLDFSAAATAAGLFTAPLAILVLGFIATRRARKAHPADERGEKH